MVAVAKSEVAARTKRAEEAEKQRIIEGLKKAMQDDIDEAASLLTAAEKEAGDAENEAWPLSSRDCSLSAAEMRVASAKVEEMAKTALAQLEEALVKVTKVEEEEAYKAYDKQDVPYLKQRYDKARAKLERADATAKAASEKADRKAYAELEQKRTEMVTVIRSKMAAEEKSGEQFFEGVAGGEAISAEKFGEFVKSLGEAFQLEEGSSEKLFAHIVGKEASISKEGFAELILLYYKCVKATVLTETISIKAKTVRRLDLGEVLEALEGPSKEEGANVQRVRCKAVKDDAEGWVTIAGNQGTAYLEPGGNIYTVVKETMLTNVLSVEDSETIRRVSKGELIEVLEFGKKDETAGMLRVRGKAKQDGATGWITISGNQGTPFLEPC